MSASLDLAAPKLGSGARFAKLSSTLKARGAKDPDALAAYIGRKKWGPKRMGAMAAHAHASPAGGISLAAQGTVLRSPDSAPSPGDVLRDLAGIREAPGHAPAGRRYPVTGPGDVIPVRNSDGTVRLQHRHGGGEIAQIRENPDGTWVAKVGGKDLEPRTHQRAALMEAVGTYNKTFLAGRHATVPLQPAPVQTPLMVKYGITPERGAALATPAAGVSAGPRVTVPAAGTDSDSDGDTGTSGLSPRAQGIFRKLKAKGWPDARAMAFARNADKFNHKAAAL